MNKTTKISSINVRVDEELKNRITRLAAVQGITISEMMRYWYEDIVENLEDVLADELEAFENFKD